MLPTFCKIAVGLNLQAVLSLENPEGEWRDDSFVHKLVDCDCACSVAVNLTGTLRWTRLLLFLFTGICLSMFQISVFDPGGIQPLHIITAQSCIDVKLIINSGNI